MTKLTALSLGILLVLVIVALALFRKKAEVEPRPQDSELSLDEKLPAQSASTQKDIETDSPADRAVARRAEADAEAKSQIARNNPEAGGSATNEAETIAEVKDPNAAAPIEMMPEDYETNIKPETPRPAFDIKNFAVDEVLALPTTDKQKFLERNKLSDPEKYRRFRYLSDVGVIDRLLKGRYRGTIEGKGWTIALDIAGQLDGEHFNGQLAVNLFSATQDPISSSSANGPLDSHVRVVDEGDKNSLLIMPSSEGEGSMFQIFIGNENRDMLAGNYYVKGEDGTFERIGPFVLKRI